MKFHLIYGLTAAISYGAHAGKFSFCITYIEDYGWAASYKDAEYEGKQSSHFINNGDESSLNKPFATRQQAEAACRHTYKKLKKN